MLEVQAFDAFGNKFSSIRGLSFHWNITTIKRNEKSTKDVIEIAKFSKSSLKAYPELLALESKGKHGFQVLLFGAFYGSANVNVEYDSNRSDLQETIKSVSHLFIYLFILNQNKYFS